jgi:hypothetical protein
MELVMSRISMNRKSVLIAIALGFTALGSTSMPASAGMPGVSQFFNAPRIAPSAFPHSGSFVGSQFPGNPIRLGGNIPQPNPGNKLPVVSQTVGNTQQKAPVPLPYSPVGPQAQGNKVVPGPANPYPMASDKPQKPVYNKGPTPVSGCDSSVPGACGNSGNPPSPPNPAPQNNNPPTPVPNVPNVNVQLPPIVIPVPAPQPVVYPQPVVVSRPQVAAAQPAVVQAPVANAIPAATQEPCNCLTKQYLTDGSVLFRDVCTKEAAIATADELRAQAQALAQPQAPAAK